MKNFLRKIGLFAALALALAIGLQALLSWRMRDKILLGSDNLHLHDQQADLVLLGSSRCWAHFDPNFFEKEFGTKAINIGMSGHSEIDLNRLRLESYLAKNKKPSFVIFNFDPMASPDSVNQGENYVLKDIYARYAFWPDPYNAPILDFLRYNWAEKYIPGFALIKYKMVLPALRPPKEVAYVTYGYENTMRHWDTVAQPPSGVMKQYFFKDNDVPAISRALAALKKTCDDNHIKLLCIQTPIYKSAYDAKAFARSGAICKQLGVDFLDTDSEAFRNCIDCFYNSNHMNRTGVEKMNAVLADDARLRQFLQ